MNGTEQRNARMSLANDILKHSGSLMPSEKQKPRPARREKPKAKTICKPKNMDKHEHVPGVSWSESSRRWNAYYYNGEAVIKIGAFPTQARAVLAKRLYMLWVKRGLVDSPNKPERRQYIRWQASKNQYVILG